MAKYLSVAIPQKHTPTTQSDKKTYEPKSEGATATSLADTLPSARHKKYWVDDDLFTFSVEDGKFKFRIHRYFLIRESKFFRELLHTPTKSRGADDDDAIPLPGVTSREFECLLDFLYEGMHDDYAGGVSIQDWIDILSAATRFGCERIRDRAIRQIDAVDAAHALEPVEKIVLANTFNIPAWLLPSYKALCERAEPLSIAEGEKLGLTATVLVMHAREKVRALASVQAGTGPLCPRNLELTVRTVFNLPTSGQVAKIAS